MSKPKPCTLGKTHKWKFAGNTTSGDIKVGVSARFIRKGRYRCECGETKLGAPVHNFDLKR